jgi:hypothetical protein
MVELVPKRWKQLRWAKRAGLPSDRTPRRTLAGRSFSTSSQSIKGFKKDVTRKDPDDQSRTAGRTHTCCLVLQSKSLNQASSAVPSHGYWRDGLILVRDLRCLAAANVQIANQLSAVMHTGKANMAGRSLFAMGESKMTAHQYINKSSGYMDKEKILRLHRGRYGGTSFTYFVPSINPGQARGDYFGSTSSTATLHGLSHPSSSAMDVQYKNIRCYPFN